LKYLDQINYKFALSATIMKDIFIYKFFKTVKDDNIFFLNINKTDDILKKEYIIKIKNDFNETLEENVDKYHQKFNLKPNNNIKKTQQNKYLKRNNYYQYTDVILCPIIELKTPDEEIDKIKTNFYKLENLNNRLNLLYKMISKYILKNEQVFIFTASQKFLSNLNYFMANFKEVKYSYICGESSTPDKKNILNKFENNEIQILFSTFVLSGI
jgi:superfamily II DNA or RNA helicase